MLKYAFDQSRSARLASLESGYSMFRISTILSRERNGRSFRDVDIFYAISAEREILYEDK
jgi:hypothetical protein